VILQLAFGWVFFATIVSSKGNTWTRGAKMNELARRLLRLETKGDAGSDDLAYATNRVCEKLLHRLSRLLGRDGSYALFTRSLKQAQTKCSLLQPVRIDPDTTSLNGLWELLHDQEPPAALELCLGIIESFLALFATFVGEDLARKLVEGGLINPGDSEAASKGDN
jgi:hypothetical protein